MVPHLGHQRRRLLVGRVPSPAVGVLHRVGHRAEDEECAPSTVPLRRRRRRVRPTRREWVPALRVADLETDGGPAGESPALVPD